MKTAKLELKPLPVAAVPAPGREEREEKKRSGIPLRSSARKKERPLFYWLWSKIKAPFARWSGEADSAVSGELGEFGIEPTAANSARESAGLGLGRADESAASLSLRVRDSAHALWEASPWLGRAAMFGTAAVVSGVGILAASHFLNRAGLFKASWSGPIASGIRIPRGGSSGLASTPAGSIGSEIGVAAGLGEKSGQSSASIPSEKSGKSKAAPKGEPEVSPAFPTMASGGIGALSSDISSPRLSGGAPVGQAAALKVGGRQAQEALLKALDCAPGDASCYVKAMPLAQGTPLAYSGNLGNIRGRALTSKSGGHLRAMTRYNHAMETGKYDTAAQNGINQFENNGIASSQGIGNGTGLRGTPNINPSALVPVRGGPPPGGGFQDISQACTKDQIEKGWISNGTICIPGPGLSQTETTPWKSQADAIGKLVRLAILFLSLSVIFWLLAVAASFFGLEDLFRGMAKLFALIALIIGVVIIIMSIMTAAQGGQALSWELEMAAGGIVMGLSWLLMDFPFFGMVGTAVMDVVVEGDKKLRKKYGPIK